MTTDDDPWNGIWTEAIQRQAFAYRVGGSRRNRPLTMPEHFRVSYDLRWNVLVPSNHYNPVSPSDELPADGLVHAALVRMVMRGAVAEDDDIGFVKEVGDTTGLLKRLLGLIRKLVAALRQEV